MPDEIRALALRVRQLESELRGAAIRDVVGRDAPSLLAWPGDVSDGNVITATHINSIAASVRQWQGAVDANGYALSKTASVAIYETAGPLDEKWWHLSPTAGNFIFQAVNDAFSAATPILEVRRTGHVVNDFLVYAAGIAFPSLPASNPGAGSKKIWYDPADGNRVKFAP